MTTPCLICSAERLKRWASVGPWTYRVCRSCGTVQLERVPSHRELADYYNSVFRVNREVQEKKVVKAAGTYLDSLARHLPEGGKLLEIGSSYGCFLERARTAGWKVEGVEMSREAVEFARRERGLFVHAGELREVIGELSPPYDAVLMFHVIEHSPAPCELLRDVASILRPGGVICIRTPNGSSWLSSVCGRTWEWLSPPAHIALFSPAALVSSMKNSGFGLLELKTQRGDASNPLYELSRACGKRLRRSARGSSQKAVQPSQRRLYPYIRLIERISDACYAPIQPLENMGLGKRGLLPEILVLASKRPGSTRNPQQGADVTLA